MTIGIYDTVFLYGNLRHDELGKQEIKRMLILMPYIKARMLAPEEFA